MIAIMLEHKTKPKCKTLGLTLNQALDILDYDKKGKLSSAADKRGAIEVVRNALAPLPKDKETSEIIYSMIDAIKRVEALQLTAIFKNFHLKKIILPLEIYEELKKQCQTIVKDSIVSDYDYFMGIPVECNENISHIQYVVEGDFAYV